MLGKQLALTYANGLQNYELYKRMTSIGPSLYPNDFSFYDDTFVERHQRNIKQIAFLQSLLAEKKISPQALLFNTSNSYYPSFILYHHETIFKKIFKAEGIGAYFRDGPTPFLINQTLEMPEDSFFYSSLTSPYLTHCCFKARMENQDVLCVVALGKDRKIKDFGAIISSDHLLVGYNFNGVRPIAVMPIPSLEEDSTEAFLSLKDLQKALHITLQYTKMRKQFMTIDKSHQERVIISYQAVAARILSAFGLFVALSELFVKSKTAVTGQVHRLILKELIHLRQCCGGFGFLQVSGHPGCLQRVSFRAAMDSTVVSLPSYQKAYHFYSHPEEVKQHYWKYNQGKADYVDLFTIFVSLSSVDPSLVLLQAALQAMHNTEQFSRHVKDNPHRRLLEYLLTKYILEQGQRVRAKESLLFVRTRRDELLIELAKDIPTFAASLEMGSLRNIILGREDRNAFYEEVVKISRASGRNQKDFSEYVKAPVAALLKRQRASL